MAASGTGPTCDGANVSRDFKSLGEFGEYLLKQLPRQLVALEAGLEEACALIEKEARAEFGVYQPAIGPFPNWAPLAEATKDERVRLGYTEDDPLLRSGSLRDDTGHEVRGLEGVVGNKSEIMVYQELGTEHIPPRPVLGPAAVRCQAQVERIIGTYAIAGLMGGALMTKGLLHQHGPLLGEDYQLSST